MPESDPYADYREEGVVAAVGNELSGPSKIENFAKHSGQNAVLEDALFNDIEPKYRVEKETLLHRRMSDMATQGYTIREIASFLDRSEECVSNILRQPFNRQRMIEQMQKNVADEMKAFLEAEVMPSLKRIQTIAKSAEKENATASEKSVALAANQELVNRFCGKPTQLFKEEKVDVSKATDAALEKQVKEILQEEQEHEQTSQEKA